MTRISQERSGIGENAEDRLDHDEAEIERNADRKGATEILWRVVVGSTWVGMGGMVMGVIGHLIQSRPGIIPRDSPN